MRRAAAVGFALVGILMPGMGRVPAGAAEHETDGTPPKAIIIYSANVSSGGKQHLVLTDWPNPKPRLLKPKIVGKYGLGDHVAAPQFSPDATKVLFIANRILPTGKHVESDVVKGTDLWVLDVKANTAKPLTTDGASYLDPQWSPDGRHVCAISYEGCWPTPPIDSIEDWKLNLYVWDVSTGRRTFLSHHVDGVAWSRDSSYLYYSGTTEKWGTTILRVPRHGGEPEVVLGQVQWIGWVSPNGKYLSFGGFRLGIKTLGADKVRYFLHQKSPIMQPTHRWAPDNRRIALMNVIEGGYPINAGLTILDTRSGLRRDVEGVSNVSAIVGWSGNGDWIILTRYKDLKDAEDESLFAVYANTGEVTPLLSLADMTGFDWHELPGR